MLCPQIAQFISLFPVQVNCIQAQASSIYCIMISHYGFRIQAKSCVLVYKQRRITAEPFIYLSLTGAFLRYTQVFLHLIYTHNMILRSDSRGNNYIALRTPCQAAYEVVRYNVQVFANILHNKVTLFLLQCTFHCFSDPPVLYLTSQHQIVFTFVYSILFSLYYFLIPSKYDYNAFCSESQAEIHSEIWVIQSVDFLCMNYSEHHLSRSNIKPD